MFPAQWKPFIGIMQRPKYVSDILSRDVGFRQLISVVTQKLNETLFSEAERERSF
jgi:hypothetical protein